MEALENRLLSIGEVAERSGMSVSALRFYEQVGLLAAPQRAGGRRRYDLRVLRRLAFIEMAKRAGFSLAEVGELLDGFDETVPASERWRLLAARKLPEVEALIEQAGTMKDLLEQGLECECLRLDIHTLFVSGRQSWYPSPFAYRRGPGLVHVGLLFDTLVWKDSTGALMPWLAADWESSASGEEWRFSLRDGVKWHDGSSLTADDVAFSFEYRTTGAGRHCRGVLRGLDAVAEVRAEGRSTVIFRLYQGYGPFAEWVAGGMMIIPAHVWSGVSDPAALRGPPAIMGSGPYRLESHEEGTTTYVYTANPAYFLGVPYVRRLEFTAAADPIRALHRGQLDVASAGGEEDVSGTALHELEDPRYGKITAPGEWTRSLQFNLTRGFPLDDVRFRRAIAHAIDRRDLVTKVLGGRGELGSMGGMAPSHPTTPPDLADYARDISMAGHLLDEIGLNDSGGDGWRELPDGTPFTPELQTSADCSGDTARLIAHYLNRVGINVRVVTLDQPAADGAAVEGRYQMALVGYGSLGGDADWLRLRLSSTVPARMPARVHGYQSPAFEALAARQMAASDPVERTRLVQEMQRQAAHDVPFIHLYVPVRTVFFDRQVFDAWYFTPGGVCGAYPGPLNKHALVTGRKTGFG
ncbi:MAG: ABC transporter substrate-binding protein [Acidimicrobiales bacterium]